MPRRSSRLDLRSAAAEQQKKRASDNSFSTPEATRKSKRHKLAKDKHSIKTKPAKSTEEKSRYFRNQPLGSLDAETTELSGISSTTPSAYEEGGENSLSVPSATDESESESGSGPAKRRGGWGWASGRKKAATTAQGAARVKAGSSAKPAEKGKELWREGVKTGLGPGKEVFIKLPKPRDAGDTLYEDHTIHPNTMLFLKDLKANNQREWLKSKYKRMFYVVLFICSPGIVHDADFRTSKRDWDTFVESLTEKIIEKDSTIPELPAKDLVFTQHVDLIRLDRTNNVPWGHFVGVPYLSRHSI